MATKMATWEEITSNEEWLKSDSSRQQKIRNWWVQEVREDLQEEFKDSFDNTAFLETLRDEGVLGEEPGFVA